MICPQLHDPLSDTDFGEELIAASVLVISNDDRLHESKHGIASSGTRRVSAVAVAVIKLVIALPAI